MAQLLGPDAPRSDDHDPEAAAAAAPDDPYASRPLTGAFTEPAAVSAFSGGSFREAFPLHAVVLAALAVLAVAWPVSRAAWSADDVLFLILELVALAGRVRLHYMQDEVRSQRLGSGLWTATVVLVFVVDMHSFVTDSEGECTAARQLGDGFGTVDVEIQNGDFCTLAREMARCCGAQSAASTSDKDYRSVNLHGWSPFGYV